MHAFLFASLLASTVLPALDVAASSDWVTQDATGTDLVEVRFDSEEPHEVDQKMLRFISYGTEEGCQLTASFSKTLGTGWHVGYVEGVSGDGMDQSACAFPSGMLAMADDIVMYRMIDNDTIEFSIGHGEKGEAVLSEIFSGIFKMKEL